MKRVLTLLFLATACASEPKVPEHVLPAKKMESIMLDLIQADGYIANAPANDSLIKTKENRYRIYQQVLALHQTNQKQFTQSLRYYEQHPTLLKKVVEDMEKNLNKQISDTSKKHNGSRPLPR